MIKGTDVGHAKFPRLKRSERSDKAKVATSIKVF